MNEIPLLHRLWVGFVGINAAFVSYAGLFKPKFLDEKFTWAELPPLHARFVGGLYLFGAVFLLGSLFCRRWVQVAETLFATAIFTTAMLVLTLLNWNAFDLDLTPALVWVIAYLLFGPVSLALALVYWRHPTHEADGPEIPSWQRSGMRSLAALFALVGAGLLVARSAVADAWPWPVSDGVAQFYGGPFLTLAWCSWAAARRRSLSSIRLYLAAMAALGVSVTVVAIIHRGVFDGGNPATWLWFATFAAIAIAATGALVVSHITTRAAQGSSVFLAR